MRCHVLICPEAEGGFSAYAMQLPGVVSQGETEDETLANIAEAFREAILSYGEEGKGIPWSTITMDWPHGAKETWIVVNA